ncbi:hypothetical protein GOV08_01620, partial [Candidatus Woesearchaeota archaeon]|nr:hypothetical protein [Candidatus Woesearchaeota archaeon]
MEQEVLNKEIVEFFLEKNILIGSDAQKTVLNLTKEQKTLLFENIKKKISDEELFVLDKQTISRLINKAEKVKENAQEKNHTGPKVNVVFSYDEKSVKRDITHFVAYFRQRFKAFEQMMQGRQEIIGRVSVSRAKNKREKENVSIIGMVRDKALTRNKHLMITVEDLTGTIKILVNKNRDDLFKIANDIVFDEVIGIEGNVSKDLIFANKIIMPDIPLTKELKKSPLEEYAAFLGDPHFGSNKFLKKEFDRLINWLNGRGGDERQKAMASKIKYLFIVGDLVDGVGIYPDQEEDLEFPDIYEQYREFTEFLIQIPKDIKIIVSPGNHDAMRISEPQPPLSEEFSKEVHGLPNVVFVSNPSVVNIGYFEGFEGF